MKVDALTDFTSLGLAEPLLRALRQEGYTNPTPIQAQSIPALLEGRDLLGIAQTGTGKTAAFALPILDRLIKNPRKTEPRMVRTLILAPTRELAVQIADSFRTYGRFAKLFVGVVVGGVSMGPQRQQLSRGLDVLVATPGRLLDHMGGGAVRLDKTEVIVLDEADHMLDLGFILPIRKIVSKLPAQRQNLFFSATMPKEIAGLAGELLNEPVEVSVTPVATTAERIAQEVFHVETSRKRDLLVELLQRPNVKRTIVFTRTKRGADRVAEILDKAGLPSAAIHGNKSQGQRQRALTDFRSGRAPVLVATDIAARGIDVDGVTHVVNFELPEVPESYVHRIGRTARAGNEGAAFSLCDHTERHLLRAIEKLTRQQIPAEDRRSPGSPALDAPRQGQRAGKPGGRSGYGKPRSSFEGRPRRDFEGKPRGEFGDKPRGDFQDKPRSNFEGRPRRDFEGKPRSDFADKPRNGFSDKPRNGFEGKPRGEHQGRPRGDFEGKPHRGERPGQRHGERHAAGRPEGGAPYAGRDGKPARQRDGKPGFGPRPGNRPQGQRNRPQGEARAPR
jgi:ATP-dependent RNA helicase RhlE